MTGITYNAWHLRQKAAVRGQLLHRSCSRAMSASPPASGPAHALSAPAPLRLSSGQAGALLPDGALSRLRAPHRWTLRSRLSHGPLPVLAAGIVTCPLARALGEAHQQGIVHGDLRPENVLPLRGGARSRSRGSRCSCRTAPPAAAADWP